MPPHSLPLAGEPPPTPEGVPLLRKGFRPFFALAALHALVAVPTWIVIRSRIAPVPGHADTAQWHAHEMLFGFTVAVIAGFLLTAATNWTKRVTATGPLLGFLVIVWLLGRVAGFVPGLPPVATAIADLAFLPALAFAVGRAVIAADSRRNYVFLVLLAALFAASLLTHLDRLGHLPGGGHRGHLLATDLVVLVILVVTGRIIPAFTRNTTGESGIEGNKKLDGIAFAAMTLLTVFDAFDPYSEFGPFVALAVSGLALLRMRRWGTSYALGDPLLWVLHLGYLWIPLGLALRGAGAFTAHIPTTAALHALTAGAIGTLTLGMMTRVSLGHTGRPRQAGNLLAVAFACVIVAAVVRVAGGIIGGGLYPRSLEVSATLWVVAFGIYAVRVAPVLFRARPDGRPG